MIVMPLGPRVSVQRSSLVLGKHYTPGKKLNGPASIRQKNSSLPKGSTVSDVNKYIKPKKHPKPKPAAAAIGGAYFLLHGISLLTLVFLFPD